MPVVSESGCGGGGRESIPAGRDESMQRERGGGRELMNAISPKEGIYWCNVNSTVPGKYVLGKLEKSLQQHIMPQLLDYGPMGPTTAATEEQDTQTLLELTAGIL
ncbi:hypothetical protein EYF80_025406 [Liparis tanakae]|uniref:Uncharacterized protein n=1 Tax=Liparis tanakae TaxID=230148 RepID=A0A4Z2HGJ7_9TELE|nr:hypothetical protein EYF80_025406 [Liparis tanakae]